MRWRRHGTGDKPFILTARDERDPFSRSLLCIRTTQLASEEGRLLAHIRAPVPWPQEQVREVLANFTASSCAKVRRDWRATNRRQLLSRTQPMSRLLAILGRHQASDGRLE